MYHENWSREVFIIDSALETNSWTYKIKVLNIEKITGSFYDKKNKQKKPDSHITDKVEIVLVLSSYAIK